MEREIDIICVKNNEKFYGRLDNIEAELKGHKFIRTHKSYLINFRYISKISYEYIEMSNGMKVPISQSKRKEVRSILMKAR